MIEVRITACEFAEYSRPESQNVFVKGKLIAAGVPIDSGEPFKLNREGILEFVGHDELRDCQIWRWYEANEDRQTERMQ